MTWFALALFVLCLAGCGDPALDVDMDRRPASRSGRRGVPAEAVKNVIVVWGQSNAGARDRGTPQSDVDTIHLYSHNLKQSNLGWGALREEDTNTWGVEFGVGLSPELPIGSCIIQVWRGGSSLDADIGVGKTYWDTMVASIDDALATSPCGSAVDTFWILQGENDALSSAVADRYADNYAELDAAIRSNWNPRKVKPVRLHADANVPEVDTIRAVHELYDYHDADHHTLLDGLHYDNSSVLALGGEMTTLSR